ncbi:AAA family ATPase [Sinomicrobium sp.]
MKILSVRIKNLASLEGITEIDFTEEPLRSAGIFAITGPTGAGKSTILDALCLALYAKTPRYRTAEGGIDINDVGEHTIKQGDVRGILRDGTTDGFAEVDFEGVDKQLYRATWSVRRAYNRPDGSLQPYDIKLKNISNRTDIPGRKMEILEEIERCVGLNFEQFTRSVLLAQGDFTAFLKAGKDEKSALLEKLTGTYVYSQISKRVYENYKEQEQLLRDLRVRHENTAILSPEEITKLLELKKESETAAELQQKEEEELSKELSWHEKDNSLQQEQDKAVQAYQRAQLIRNEAAPREQLLDKLTRFQTVKPAVDNLKYIREQLQSKQQQLQEISNKLTALSEQKSKLKQQSDQIASRLKSALKTQEETRPLISKARDADIRIFEFKKQLDQAQKESEEAKGEYNRQKDKLAIHTRNTQAIQNRLDQIDRWLKEHQSRRTVAEEQQFIISKLKDAEVSLREIHSLQLQLRDLQGKQEKVCKEQDSLSQSQKTILNTLQKLKEHCKTLQQTLSQIDIATLEKERDRLHSTATDLNTLALQWNIWHEHLQQKSATAERLDEERKAYTEKRELLSATTKELETATVKHDTSGKILEKAKLTVSENTDRLRQSLSPGEACPVCGSTEHPYAVHSPLSDRLLEDLETEHRNAKEQRDSLLGAYNKLEQAIAFHKANIPLLKAELSSEDEKIRQAEEKCRNSDVYTSLIALPEDRRSEWIQEKQSRQKEKLKILEQQIKAYNITKKQLEDEKDKLEQKRLELSAVEKEINEKEKERSLGEEKLASRSREEQKLTTDLQQTRKLLKPYFPSEEWYGHWQNNPETFVECIVEFAREWKTRAEELSSRQRELDVAKTDQKHLEEQLALSEKTAKLKTQQLLDLQSQYNQMLQKRRSLLQGKAADEVETELEHKLSNVREEQESITTVFNELNHKQAGENTRGEEVKKEIERLQGQESKYASEIDLWLESQPEQHSKKLTIEELEPLLEYSYEWIEEERNALHELTNAVNQAASIVTERRKALEHHRSQRPSKRSEEEVVQLRNAVRKTREEHKTKIAEINYKLRDDEKLKQGLSQILKDIEKRQLVFDNWAKLNEVIGSADGKKFRQIAQEYTLDLLLGYANVHLEVLSKRYVLQRIPDSLGLQVLDKDMGDEIRTVYSLSGGESFLVSLALALALASLSSTRMKVESLFIDEGFGSLDPSTLNIAMDALERLHNQGRKVGVISHVQEMTERIPVRINVRKQRNGKSKVEVSGW